MSRPIRAPAKTERPAVRASRTLAILLGVALCSVSGTTLLCRAGLVAPNSKFLAESCALLACPGTSYPCAPESPSNGEKPTTAIVRRLNANPASAHLWVAAGHSYFAERQLDKARYCFERAAELAPRSPPVLVETAAFLLATASQREGLPLLSRALALTREYDDSVFRLYDRIAGIETILSQGIPVSPAPAQSYFQHLLGQDDPAPAAAAWAWLSAQRLADATLARRYIVRLLERGSFDEASEVAAGFLPAAERPQGGNRIHHGGFEADSCVAPLDWRITPTTHDKTSHDTAQAWEGDQSLRLEFDGQANLEYRHVAQQVIVEPGRWKLSAWIRTAAITTDQGIGLRLFDARSASRWQVWTENLRGDNGWTLIEKTFTVPPATRLVQLEIVRHPSRMLDSALAGIAWVDNVSLKPL